MYREYQDAELHNQIRSKSCHRHSAKKRTPSGKNPQDSEIERVYSLLIDACLSCGPEKSARRNEPTRLKLKKNPLPLENCSLNLQTGKGRPTEFAAMPPPT